MIEMADIRSSVTDVAQANGAQIAILFGSFARNTATAHSDIDLIFVEETNLPFLDRMDRYLGPLVDRLRTSVEVLVYTPEEFERMAQYPFIGQALAEGVVLYESGEVLGNVSTLARAGAS